MLFPTTREDVATTIISVVIIGIYLWICAQIGKTPKKRRRNKRAARKEAEMEAKNLQNDKGGPPHG